MTELFRYDQATPIKSWERTDEGYLRVWCRAARTGVQTYYKKDSHTPVKEYRPEEEVAKPESLQTFGMKPVTWGHPKELLDSANTNQHQIGHAGSQVRFNDGFVEVALMITDEDKINRILRKDAVECSAGYKVDADDTPGITPEGEHYDVVQRNIRVNHIAIVPKGRAGKDVRLLMDSADGSETLIFNQEPSTPPKAKSMAVIQLDGLSVEVPTEAAAPINDYLRRIRADNEILQNEVETTKTSLEEAEGRIDALSDELEELEARNDGDSEDPDTIIDLTDARIDQSQLDQLLLARMDLLENLAPAFPEDHVFDSIGEEELYAQAFENIYGQAPDEDADFGYVRGMVDGALASVKEDSSPEDDRSDEEPVAPTPTGSLRSRVDSANSPAMNAVVAGIRSTGNQPPAAEKARQDAASNSKQRWQKPMRASQALVS